MDGHVVVEPGGEQNQSGAQAVLKRISDVGGLAVVVDWHAEAGCNRHQFRGYVDVLSTPPAEACSMVQVATTPDEAAALWRRRVAAHMPELGAIV
jgi:hypothetical protein